MSHTLFFSLAAAVAAALVCLALVTPQGLGARSPGPFGHPLAPLRAPPVATTPPPLRGASR